MKEKGIEEENKGSVTEFSPAKSPTNTCVIIIIKHAYLEFDWAAMEHVQKSELSKKYFTTYVIQIQIQLLMI